MSRKGPGGRLELGRLARRLAGSGGAEPAAPVAFVPGLPGTPVAPTVRGPGAAVLRGELDVRAAARAAWRHRALLGLIVVGAAALRLSAVGYGHRFLSFQPDEDANALRALELAGGALNPGYFYYPALLWYLLAAAYRLVFWLGRGLGFFGIWKDFVALYRDGPTLFYLGRLLSVAFGAATVAALYSLGRRAFSASHGLLAGAFLAGAFLHVRDSALGTTEAPLTFFVVLALLGAVRVYQRGGVRDYALAGLAAGLAAATKYNAVLVLVAVVVAHVLQQRDAGVSIPKALRERRLLGTGLLAGLVFVALNPFILIRWREAWGGPDEWGSLSWEWHYLHSVEYLDLRPVWWYHLSVSLRYGLGLALLTLALMGMLRAAWRRDAVSVVLLSFTLAFFGAMATLQAVFVRYMTPLVPVLCLFAAAAVLAMSQRVPWSGARRGVIAGLVALALWEPVWASAGYSRLAHHVDTRIAATDYMRTTLKRGSLIASYGPSVTWRSTIPRWHPMMYARDPAQSWPDALNVLKSRGIRYFLLHKSALEVFSPEFPELDRALQQSATLIREFSPYRPGVPVAPVYDRNDAYYFPVGGFRGVVRPGPLVQLYRLD